MAWGRVDKAKGMVWLYRKGKQTRQRARITDDDRFWQPGLEHGQMVQGTIVNLSGRTQEGFRLAPKHLGGKVPRSSKLGRARRRK